MPRGPYKRFLDPNADASITRKARKRLGIDGYFDQEIINQWKEAANDLTVRYVSSSF